MRLTPPLGILRAVKLQILAEVKEALGHMQIAEASLCYRHVHIANFIQFIYLKNNKDNKLQNKMI